MSQLEIELLAPAGKWDVVKAVSAAGADAVYAGGKRFNMRMLKSKFNFTDEELRDVVNYLHDQGKKLYVTVNNLYYEEEISELKDYLVYLQEIEADALIVQDLGVVRLYEELGLSVPLHASVQMGIGNLKAVKFLQERGFSRVILSKNLSLKEIQEIHDKTTMGIEYFAHGDLCISHTGQCYMSSFIAGESGNRGRCIKPCRWIYQLNGDSSLGDKALYYLAHNDLCLYPHIKELIQAGVSSLKIEGRMRSAEYLATIINIYREAIDRLLQCEDDYVMDEDQYKKLHENRVRDFTTGNIFGRPGKESIGFTGEREPVFISTARTLPVLEKTDLEKNSLTEMVGFKELSVKVGDIKGFELAIENEVDTVIIDYENFRQKSEGFNISKIDEALNIVANTDIKIVLETPRIVTQDDFSKVSELSKLKNADKLHSIMVNDYGSLKAAQQMDYKVWAGHGLNTSNSKAVELLENIGVERINLPLELGLEKLNDVFKASDKVELMVHGPLCGMITDYCIASAVMDQTSGLCRIFCAGDYALLDELGYKYRIRTDFNCRNFIYYPHDLCLFSFLPLLAEKGLQYIRIDGQFYDNARLDRLITIYKEAVRNIRLSIEQYEILYFELLNMFPEGLTASPIIRTVG